MARRYHVLLSREKAGSPWAVEFGAYDRNAVLYERDDYRDQGVCVSNLKVVTTSDDQASIDAAVARLNAKLAAQGITPSGQRDRPTPWALGQE